MATARRQASRGNGAARRGDPSGSGVIVDGNEGRNMKKLLLAFAVLSLLTACSTYSASFNSPDAGSSVAADYRFMGQMGGP